MVETSRDEHPLECDNGTSQQKHTLRHKPVLIGRRNESAGNGIFYTSFNFREVPENHQKKHIGG